MFHYGSTGNEVGDPENGKRHQQAKLHLKKKANIPLAGGVEEENKCSI